MCLSVHRGAGHCTGLTVLLQEVNHALELSSYVVVCLLLQLEGLRQLALGKGREGVQRGLNFASGIKYQDCR